MAHRDRWGALGAIGSCELLFAITPSDGTDLQEVVRGIYVGVAGNLAVMLLDGITTVTFTAVPVGTNLPVRVKRVMATNTTAGGLMGMA